MSSNKRFQNLEHLFYSLSTVKLLRATQNVSVCGWLKQNDVQPIDLIQNIHLCRETYEALRHIGIEVTLIL